MKVTCALKDQPVWGSRESPDCLWLSVIKSGTVCGKPSRFKPVWTSLFTIKTAKMKAIWGGRRDMSCWWEKEESVCGQSVQKCCLSCVCLSHPLPRPVRIPITALDLMIFSASQGQKDMKRQTKQCFYMLWWPQLKRCVKREKVFVPLVISVSNHH